MHFMRVVFQFSEYGNVVEVRINAKSVPGKVPVSKSVIELTYLFIMHSLFCCSLRSLLLIQQNFGFVVFDSPTPVGEILRMRVRSFFLVYETPFYVPTLINNHLFDIIKVEIGNM